MSKTVIAKVQITSDFRGWWESDLSGIFINPDEIKIISAIESDGGLYLIYTHTTEENKTPQ